MNKQFDLIPIERTLEGTAEKRSPWKSLLKYAVLGVTAFIALVILFAVGSDLINPAVSGVMQKIGLSEKIIATETSPVAYAWTNPSESTDTAYYYNFQSMTTTTQNTLRPQSAAANWSYGYTNISGSGYKIDSSGNMESTGGKEYNLRMLFYVDIYVDDLALNAIKNGQITTCSVTLHVKEVGTANVGDCGHIYGTFFLCSSSTGTSSPAINDMESSFINKKVSHFDEDMGVHWWAGDNKRNDHSGSLSINLSGTERKIRFGLAYFCKVTSGVSADVYAPAPTISTAFTTDTYKNAKIAFSLGGVGEEGGSIVPATSGTYDNATSLNSWSGTAAFSSESNMNFNNSTVIGNVKAVAKEGYYFSGWKITAGGLSSSHDLRATVLNIIGGPYLNAKGLSDSTVRITASFRKITTPITTSSFNYLQELNSDGTLKLDSNGEPTAIAQGPTWTTPTTNDSGKTGTSETFVTAGGTYSNNSANCASNLYYYTGTILGGGAYNNNSMPTQAGTYRLVVGIFANGMEGNSANCLGYYTQAFTIQQVSITGGDTTGTIIPSREYSGYEYQPKPAYIDIKIKIDGNWLPYRLLEGTDYSTISSWANNVIVGTNTATLAIQTTAKNFGGQNSVAFSITPLDISGFTYVQEMAKEIQEKYKVIYTGYEQRPDVILLKIKGQVYLKGDINAGKTEKEFTIYRYNKYSQKYSDYGYAALSGESVTANNFFQIIHDDVGDYNEGLVYSNNVNVCTYNGSNGSSSASFKVRIYSGCNLTGDITVYFDIAPLDLDNYEGGEITVERQWATHVYNAKEITPVPDVVYVTVRGLSPWFKNINGNYSSYSLPVTYCFTRTEAGIEYSSAVRDKSGTGNEGQLFESWNNEFTNTLSYSNNVNVSYNGGTRVAGAEIIVSLATTGNVIGSVTTLFEITPLSLANTAAYAGNTTNQTVGLITKSGESISENYTGEGRTPTPEIKAYPNESATSVKIYENVDFTYSYEDNVNVTRNAIITITGKGNYTGSVSSTFYIVAMDAQTAVASEIASEVYTGKQIAPTPQKITFTIGGKTFENLEAGKDYKIVTGLGTNTVVSTADSKQNYITISFTGYNPKGSNKGIVDMGTSGNFYGENIKVYFAITPKNIGLVSDANVYAEWGNINREKVTYDGTRKTDLPIITGNADRTANTLYIIDTDANAQSQLVYGENEFDSDIDFIISSWGTNINAGTGAGSLTVKGVGNYTGTKEIRFNIYARSLESGIKSSRITLDTTSGSGYDQDKGGYYYTGAKIEPNVTSVTIFDLNNRQAELVLNADYTVSYGDGSKTLNYFVLNGGKVTITGKGNYEGSISTSFKILPIDQQVFFESPYGNLANEHLQKESIATDKSKTVYADYEVNANDGKKIQLVAYTTAVYPTARRVTFVIQSISGGASTVAKIEYESVELVVKDGLTLSKTTAYLVFNNNSYGIMRIYAEQYDGATYGGDPHNDGTINYIKNPAIEGDNNIDGESIAYYHNGNYNSYGFNAANDDLYSIYAKRQDKVSESFASEISKIYGEEDFTISPMLDSYTNFRFEYKISSSDSNIVNVSGTTGGASRQGRVGNVGEAEITIFHSGHVDFDNDANAYMAFSTSLTVTVEKRLLMISLSDLSVPYGTTPTFTYTYTTNGAITYTDGDGKECLQLPNRKIDRIDDILTGYDVEYQSSLHSAVNTDGYTIGVTASDTMITKGSLYDNYTISYGDCVLTVNKKLLTVTASNSGMANQIYKVYGTPNPTDYTFGYSGFVYGENETTLYNDAYFTAPTVDYRGCNEATPVGGHRITIVGGDGSNYRFEETEIDLVVTKAYVIISLESVAMDYSGNAVYPGAVKISGLGLDVDGDGVVDTTEPIQDDTTRISYSYIGSYETVAAPSQAGRYSVKVTFTATSAGRDNYQTTTKTFDDAIVINKIAPRIYYTDLVQLGFTGNIIKTDSVQPLIAKSVENGSAPRNQNASKILFAKEGEAPADCLENDTYLDYFNENNLKDTGFYDVIIVYVATAGDNYSDTIVRINGMIEVTAGLANINIKPNRPKYDYDGLSHGLSLESDFEEITWDMADGNRVTLSKSNAKLEYFVNDVYTTIAPTDVGVYAVRVTYIPTDIEQVKLTSKVFLQAIEIKPYDLANGNIGLLFTGIRSYSYDALSHTLAENDVVVRGTAADEGRGVAPKGTISITYMRNGISYSEPVHAGNYTAIVTYTPANIDNYYASMAVNLGQVITITAAGVFITSDSTFTYAFNGRGRAMEGVSYRGVVLPDGSFERPQGTLSYTYRLSGTSNAFLSDLPTDTGTYDVRVVYVPVNDDNYMSAAPVEFSRAITIQRVNPSIIIEPKMSYPYGTAVEVKYSIRGAQYDLNGPMREIDNGLSHIEIQYGTRYTTSSGSIGYDWKLEAPTESGRYSVKITFIADPIRSNYETITQQLNDCLTIENIIPTFELDSKNVVYDGKRHTAAAVRVYDNNGYEYFKWTEDSESGLNYYRGTIGYEYRRSGTNSWSTLAPSEVGVYDVRIRYYENTVKDVFSAPQPEVFYGVLEIEALVITVMPIYGQGHVYDGTSTDGDAIAYVYTYERDGYKYIVYSSVGNFDKNELIDLSHAEYVDGEGNVYTIVTDASTVTDAWLDYKESLITYLTGSFDDGEEQISFNFGDLGVRDGKAEYKAQNGASYVIDLDLGVVRLKDNVTYTLGVQSGYYFSIVSGTGAVNVIEIIPANIMYTSNDRKQGVYTVTTAGKQTLYTVNLTDMTATANGEIYDIYRSIGTISYESGAQSVQVKVDFNSLYEVTADGQAIFKSANGQAYLININTSEVERVAVLNVDSVSFTYDRITEEGTEEVTITVATDELKTIYSANAYIGSYVNDELSAIIDVKSGTVRIPVYTTLLDRGNFYSFVNEDGESEIVFIVDLQATSRENAYIYYSETYERTYLIDLANFTVRNFENLYKFNANTSRIYQEVDGVEVGFNADISSFRYNIVRNGKLYSTTTLYGAEYEVRRTALIAGNSWSGSFSLMAQGAGSYNILQGSFAVSSNYRLVFVGGITFDIERAKLSVSFGGDKNVVYDGNNKYIEYALDGILDGESVTVTQRYDGDNLNVTKLGYRTVISISSDNYYLEGGVSEWYYIYPATMQDIIVPTIKPVTYDGFKHYLELGEVERGATVTYAGSTTAPYFIEPGTYSVIATVSKPNYESLEVELTLTIAKAKYEVNAYEVPGTLTYGDALPALRSDSDLGTIALDPGQILLPSKTVYTWTFTPYSNEFYKFYEGNSADGNTITGTIEIKVNKAQAQIEVTGNLVQKETSPSAIIGIANGLANNESTLVTIEYVAGDGTRYSKMPTAPGKYTVYVTYAGDENFAETVYTTVLTIEQESNYTWILIAGIAIGALAILSMAFFVVRRQKKLD